MSDDTRAYTDGPNTHKMDAPSDVTTWTVVQTTRNVVADNGRGMTLQDEWWHIPSFVVAAILDGPRRGGTVGDVPDGLIVGESGPEAALSRTAEERLLLLPDGQTLADWIAEDIKADWPAFLFNAPAEHQAQAERGLRRTSEQLAERLFWRLVDWATPPEPKGDDA